MMYQIKENTPPRPFALFELGFRPFFSFAGIFAILSITLWMAVYVFSATGVEPRIGGVVWHSHEMVYGYALAVVAGFLLTAISNWTGLPGLRGAPLFLLLLAWVVGRIAFFSSVNTALYVAAIADGLFLLGLIVAVSLPVVKTRQWKQTGIITKLLLLLLSNLVYYAGVLGLLENGEHWGLYAGFYLLLALVFTLARRVLPFFIERGIGQDIKINNRRWVDIGSIMLFLIWAVVDVFMQQANLVAVLSILLLAVHFVRMSDWYNAGIWRRPLLWSFYLGYGFLVCGFLLKALSVWTGIAPPLVVHAFAFGGVGLVTLSMMSRVTLGHTGRNVFEPPKMLFHMFVLLITGALFRVIVPIIDMSHYRIWIGVSQVLWICAFGLFTVISLPMLFRPRVDGRPG